MNVAVKPWRCHLSAGSPGWDAERRLCSTWMHGCAECRAADPGNASFQPQQQYWDLVLAPATDRVTLQGLATAHTSIKMWQAYYSSVHTHLGYFVTDCPIFILLLEHVRGPSKFDGSQRKKQKTKKKKGLGHMDQHSQMHKPQSTPIISGVTGATVENHRHPWGQVGGSMAKLSYASPSQIHPQTHSMRF